MKILDTDIISILDAGTGAAYENLARRLGDRPVTASCASRGFPRRSRCSKTVILTTPNAEYNVRFETLPAGAFRHRDDRFEWTRRQFQDWAEAVTARFAYMVRFLPIGPEDLEMGAPTQMGVFDRNDGTRMLRRQGDE